jgi:hypothetical protein
MCRALRRGAASLIRAEKTVFDLHLSALQQKREEEFDECHTN